MMISRSILQPLLAAAMTVSLCGCLQTLDQISDALDTLSGPTYGSNYGSSYYPYGNGGTVAVAPSGYGYGNGYGRSYGNGVIPSNNVYNMTGREFLQGGYNAPRCGGYGQPQCGYYGR